MNKSPLLALCLSGLLSSATGVFATDALDSTAPHPDSTGPTNPTPPTLPTPGNGIDNEVGTGIDGKDSAPTPGTDGTGRDDKQRRSTAPGTGAPTNGDDAQFPRSQPDN